MTRTLTLIALLALALAAPVVAQRVPNAVGIGANPTALTWGKQTVVSGQVTGKDSAGVVVTLESTPAPYSEAFKAVGNPVVTDANGFYSFTVAPQASTRYRVTAKAKPTVESVPVTVLVRPRTTMRPSDRTPRRGQRVRFRGTLTPAHDGKVAQLQRRTRAGWRTVRSAPLVATTPVNGVARSRYATATRVRRTGTYRVSVVTADGDHEDGLSRARRLRVR